MKKQVNPHRHWLLFTLLRAANSVMRSVLLLATGWIAYSNLHIKHKVNLPEAIPASRKEFVSATAGKVSYYVDLQGKGKPLVLIHSINAAASAYEMRPLFMAYQDKRPVYALDLPGFGFSDRSSREYSPAFYAAVIAEFLETQVKKAADVVALSLSCEFAAQAALECPQQFHSLILISPSGFTRRTSSSSQKAVRSGFSRRIYGLLSAPLWARPLFDLIVTRPSIRYFLSRSFLGPVPTDLVDYSDATAHQPGAEIAPLYFLSGLLFTRDALTKIYDQVQVPALVIFDRDGFVTFDLVPDLVASKQNWQSTRIVPSLGLPQFEKLPETLEALTYFWDKLK
jgi:pimeloyl-ACP methyl ester carboxylesterase